MSVPVDNTPTSTVTAPVAETPVGASPRPHPADIPAPSTGDGPGPGDGGTGTSGRGGIGIGGILGGIGVILRGGSAGDDHCDPRPYPRGGRPPIDMGRTIPIIRY